MHNSIFYISRLNSMAKKSTGSDAKIAGFILTSLSDFHNFTIDFIALKTNLSYATVCRFMKKLGVSGMLDLKKQISEYLSISKDTSAIAADFDMDMIGNMPFDRIAFNTCSFSAGIVQHCHDSVDNETIAKVIDILKHADNIYFFGLGTSAITAKYAYTKFFRMEIPCSIDTDIIISKMKASTLKKGSVLFAISSSGRTKSVVDVARLAKNRGATIIALCDFAHSPLSKISDITLCTTAREANKYIDTDLPLIQGQITLVDIIYLCYYKTFVNTTSKIFNSTKDSVHDDKILN